MAQISDVSPTIDNTTITSDAQSVSGRMLTLACGPDGQTVYTGSFANLWKSEDGGETWTQLTWPQPPANQFGVPGALGGWCVIDVAVSPDDSNTVLAITRNDWETGSSGIWRTTDGGATWRQAYSYSSGQQGGQVAWANGELVFAANGAELVVSRDGGASFPDQLNGNFTFNHVAVSDFIIGGVQNVYALAPGGIEVSFDAGGNWSPDNGVPTNMGGSVEYFSSQAPSVLSVAGTDPLAVFAVANANGGVTLGPPATSRPFVCVFNGQLHFAYLDAFGSVWDAFWDGSHWNLDQINKGGKTNGPPAVSGGMPFVCVFNGQLHFAYQDSGGVIWDAFWDGSWNLDQINQGGKTNGPPAVSGAMPCVFNGQLHFAYQADLTVSGSKQIGGIWDAFWDGSHWNLDQININQVGKTNGPPAVSGGMPFVCVFNGQLHFAYQDSGGVIWDAFWDGSWNLDQINQGGKTNAPPASGGMPFVCVYNGELHFAYRDSGGGIWNPFWNGSWNYQQINLGPMLWKGDYSAFLTATKSTWTAAVLPELESQDSGNVFVKYAPGVIFCGQQRSRLYVTVDFPQSASDWRGLDDDNKVHPDLHGVSVSPDFFAEFVSHDYQFHTGTLWLLSDGGVYRSTDGGKHFQTVHNLNTLSCVNVAGAAIPGQGPVLSLNTGDNDGFFSKDGGATWISQDYGGGDNDCSFADPLRPQSMLVFTPRWDSHGNQAAHASQGQTVTVYEAQPGHLPNVAKGTNQFHTIPAPPKNPDSGTRWNASSPFVIAGFRPLILNSPGDNRSAPGDYVFILFKSSSEAVLVRTQNILGIHQASDWNNAVTGPPLPPGPQDSHGVILWAPQIVQASGGHETPVFYLGDAATPDKPPAPVSRLWKWSDGMPDWQLLVPGGGAQSAFRFFVDPYRPNLIYILDTNTKQPHVMRSDDGGASWVVDDNLETQLTNGGTLPMNRNEVTDSNNNTDVVLCDMQFHPSDALTRIAAGLAGVFQTVDGGQTWSRLLDTQALPGRPVNSYWDWISDPTSPALYVAFAGRSLVKIDLT